MLDLEDFAVEGSFVGMPDQPNVKFVVYDPSTDDPTSGPVLQLGDCPRRDFPLQAQIHPDRAIIEWDWANEDIDARVVGGKVLRSEVRALEHLDVLQVATTADVDAERDRRLSAGFAYQGKLIQADLGSQTALNVFGQRAVVAVDNGALPGDLRWADAAKDFAWIAADNSMLPLDAPSMVEMQRMASAFLDRTRTAARRLKDRIAAGEHVLDVSEASLWPS